MRFLTRRSCPDLVRIARPGAVYLGVAPEQNFTYTRCTSAEDGVHCRYPPTLELLMYKALFEMSVDRVEFACRLFSRRPQVGRTATVEALFRGLESVRGSTPLFREALQAIYDRLEKQRGFRLTAVDKQGIEKVFNVFLSGWAANGLRVPESNTEPCGTQLLPAHVDNRSPWKTMELPRQRRKLRPDTSDAAKESDRPAGRRLTGPRTLKAVGQYVSQHGSTIAAFYISNVEDYIRHSWSQYVSNLRSLPVDDFSVFIRFQPSSYTSLESIESLSSATTGETTMNLNQIGQIALHADDLDRAVAFYRDTLGMRFLFQVPPGLAFFDCGGIRLMLDAVKEKDTQERLSSLDLLQSGGPAGDL